jgi:hypothetical protein
MGFGRCVRIKLEDQVQIEVIGEDAETRKP